MGDLEADYVMYLLEGVLKFPCAVVPNDDEKIGLKYILGVLLVTAGLGHSYICPNREGFSNHSHKVTP